MPCNDGPSGPVHTVEVDNPRISAALCAVLTAATKLVGYDRLLNSVDWPEAGVDRRYVERWWQQHQEQDRRRKEREKEERRQKQVKQSALIKAQKHLTYEEQKALGLTR